MKLPERYFEHRKLQQLVENQTSYELQHAAMHVFETQQQADLVQLQFDTPVLASMFQGKKIMHLRDEQQFEFLPGESLILPANELMQIDFPEATRINPTRCLAMEIDPGKIREVILHMNEQMTRTEGKEWEFIDYNFHFTNDSGIYQILQRLLYLFTENHPSKDFFVNNMVQELVIRILQANSRKVYTTQTQSLKNSHRLAYVIDHIRTHLHRPITIKELSELACMSESNFYRVFKDELGISPVGFINQARIERAIELLKQNDIELKVVFQECGFESRSYFNRVFKRHLSVSPGLYRQRFTRLNGVA